MKSSELLLFIKERFVNVYKEHPNTDYLIALKNLADEINDKDFKISFLQGQNSELSAENQFLNDEYQQFIEMLPKDARYLDLPDGGSVHPSEQMRRMLADKNEQIRHLEEKNSDANLAGWNACVEWIIETTSAEVFTEKESLVAYDIGKQYAGKVRRGEA